MNDITVPKQPDFTSGEYVGSLAALAAANVGFRARAEYSDGHNPPQTQSGVIYAVGSDYVLLWDEMRRTYQAGKLSQLRSLSIMISPQ